MGKLIIEGLVLGLSLAILLGPIFFTLTQIAVDKGPRAGIVASSGVWVSDLIIIWISYTFILRLDKIIHGASFTFWMGLVGGLILISFGIGALLRKHVVDDIPQRLAVNDYLGFWTKGFLVNTINPFTFVFWFGVSSNYVVIKKITALEAWVFYGSIMAVIIATDSAKVLLARELRNRLEQRHFALFSKIAGVILITLGIILLIRTQSY